MFSVLLGIYLFFIIIALPCYFNILFGLLKDCFIDIKNVFISENNFFEALLESLELIFVGLVLFIFSMLYTTLILLIPILNLQLMLEIGCEFKNPFYKKPYNEVNDEGNNGVANEVE